MIFGIPVTRLDEAQERRIAHLADEAGEVVGYPLDVVADHLLGLVLAPS